MNEIFDKLIIRILIAFTLCLIIFIYKYAHVFFYPIAKKQLFKKFYPTRNIADTLHFFSRIIGIGILLSHINLNTEEGILFAFFSFFINLFFISDPPFQIFS